MCGEVSIRVPLEFVKLPCGTFGLDPKVHVQNICYEQGENNVSLE